MPAIILARWVYYNVQLQEESRKCVHRLKAVGDVSELLQNKVKLASALIWSVKEHLGLNTGHSLPDKLAELI